MADRSDRQYRESITPDVVIDNNIEATENDLVIIAAINWIKSQR